MTMLFDGIRGLGFRRGPRRMLAGICGGIAAKSGISVWILRFVMLLVFLLPVLGIGLYLAVWFVTPNQAGSIPLERLFQRE